MKNLIVFVFLLTLTSCSSSAPGYPGTGNGTDPGNEPTLTNQCPSGNWSICFPGNGSPNGEDTNPDDVNHPPPCAQNDCECLGTCPPPCTGDACPPPPCEGNDCPPCTGDSCPPQCEQVAMCFTLEFELQDKCNAQASGNEFETDLGNGVTMLQYGIDNANNNRPYPPNHSDCGSGFMLRFDKEMCLDSFTLQEGPGNNDIGRENLVVGQCGESMEIRLRGKGSVESVVLCYDEEVCQ